jgi:ppGpp synthetase/RelA/SpoT-type nucleotidyltranferase
MALTRADAKIKYDGIISKYDRLGENLTSALKGFLVNDGLDVLSSTYRVKTFDSFWEKKDRKGVSDPFEEIEDICGVRIIAFYPSDIDKIDAIIRRELDVKKAEDKETQLEPDRFGYRSFHYNVGIKPEWSHAPNYRGLNELSAEIQVRTILMHAWADLSHRLSYKKKEHVPRKFQRQMFRLGALFEIADQHFDELRQQKEEYQTSLLNAAHTDSGQFYTNQEMNVDSLQAFLDLYFPDRERRPDYTAELLEELERNKVSFNDIVIGLDKCRNLLPEAEREDFTDNGTGRWAQAGIVRKILDLTSEVYWSVRQLEVPDWVIEKTARLRRLIDQVK